MKTQTLHFTLTLYIMFRFSVFHLSHQIIYAYIYLDRFSSYFMDGINLTYLYIFAMQTLKLGQAVYLLKKCNKKQSLNNQSWLLTKEYLQKSPMYIKCYKIVLILKQQIALKALNIKNESPNIVLENNENTKK